MFADLARKGRGDPVKPTLFLFVGGAIPGLPLAYFGLRGLSRRDQIVIGPAGLAGRLVAADGGTVAWAEIVDMRYGSRAFLETLRLQLRDGRRVVIRDLSQLAPVSLLQIAEAVKTRLETGVFTPPKLVRWWQTTWAIILFIILVGSALIAAMSVFGGRKPG